jgi:urease accessory protein
MPLEITEKLPVPAKPDVTLTLPFALRQKSRLLTRLDNNEEAKLFLPRGTVLRQGDLLRTTTGLIVRVEAAPEAVSTAITDDPLQLARVCYHLGNRHVPIQIGSGWVRYLRDHVLDTLVEVLNLQVKAENVPFEPEASAYDRHSHHHDPG